MVASLETFSFTPKSQRSWAIWILAQRFSVNAFRMLCPAVRKAGDRAPPSHQPQFLPVKKTRSDFATENIQMLINLFVWDF